MAAVSMDLLKKLRAATHAPMNDCKNALVESDGDLEKAQEWLKQRGITKAAKKLDRETMEGIVKFMYQDGKVIGIKVACETDFVAKNQLFLDLVDQVMQSIASHDDVISLANVSEDNKAAWQMMFDEKVATIGESIRLTDVLVNTAPAFVYNHPGNRVASVVYHDGSANADEVAKGVALQAAAMDPHYFSTDDISQTDKDKMRATFVEQLKEEGKPADMIDKIADGKVAKALQEVTLLEQPSIMDDSKKVKDTLKDVDVTGFVRRSI